MEKVQTILKAITAEVNKVVVAQEEIVESIVISMLVGGHVLLEGPPGVAKTLTIKAFSRAINASYKRVQFTPDLMPLDVTGTNIFNFQAQQFTFRPGPIFTDLLLADEINRTPPKTQASLLEAMEEKQVTIDGTSHPLSAIFTVLATQNPLEYEGTYPLPEAQLDRFLFKLKLSHPEAEAELKIYQRYQNGLINQQDLEQINPVTSSNELLALRQIIADIKIRVEILDYLTQIIRATREHPLLLSGASPRAGVSLMLSAKAFAVTQGRDYVIPEDIQTMAYPTLRHRLILKPEAQIDGKTSDLVIKNILSGIIVPR